MSYTVILEKSVLNSVADRTAAAQSVRKTAGVLSLDTELIEHGLLFAQLQNSNVVAILEKLEGVDKVEKNDVKFAL